ncbi:MAG: GIY-YIG nuclease family protein [Alphaproteobacteria bacterium]
MPYVYIMSNKPNGTLYLGSTTNLVSRISQHKALTGKHFTAKYELIHLVWYEKYAELKHAQEQEWRMKKWKRRWKTDLINALNPDWRDLSELLNL